MVKIVQEAAKFACLNIILKILFLKLLFSAGGLDPWSLCVRHCTVTKTDQSPGHGKLQRLASVVMGGDTRTISRPTDSDKWWRHWLRLQLLTSYGILYARSSCIQTLLITSSEISIRHYQTS